jgi:hypothetical protein
MPDSTWNWWSVVLVGRGKAARRHQVMRRGDGQRGRRVKT